MKDKKGFTFIELLVVIGLLGLIVTVAAPSIMKSVRKTNIRLCYNKSALILSTAELYAQDLNFTGEIYVSEMLENNNKYLEADEKSENCASLNGENNTNGCMVDSLNKINLNSYIITITKVGNTYKAVWKNNGDICDEE